MFNPKGPMTAPEMISPMMLGMFSFRSNTGASRIMARINENISTGFWSGM
jgi:hypothetical protein